MSGYNVNRNVHRYYDSIIKVINNKYKHGPYFKKATLVKTYKYINFMKNCLFGNFQFTKFYNNFVIL